MSVRGKPLGNGFYDRDGELHVDLEEFVVAAGGDPRSEEDLATAIRAIEREGIPVEVREK